MQGLGILMFVGALGISFLMAGMEAGVFALSRLRIRQQMRAGNRRARALYGYLDRPEDFLWTIFVGNTVANLVAFSLGVIGLYRWVGHQPWIYWPAVVTGIILVYALVELLPKTLFRQYPNRLCMMLALPFRLLDVLLRPLVAPMAILSRMFLRFSGGQRFTGHLFGNREELRIVMQESAHGLTSDERAMINRVLDLQNIPVRQLTIPLNRVVSVSRETNLKELLELFRTRGFSRVPAWKEDRGGRRIVGLVNLNPLIYAENLATEKTASEFLSPALYLDEGMRLEVAFRQMQRTGQRLAIVLDADRREIGIISLQDILKFVFGQVPL